ncbi:VCBS repeat-containing protein [Rugosimonospora africana]|uniref:Repeat domain-containing protein n=1 Tax=Rugosimonospora africana TaxID=556532 RepID=A0A8J3R2U5_9ACTN|nr:VCBS repeat-containing protein [Rugosimonospora africana]GIH20522.1 hypothetical protein Raf01_86940 [Rugosimonospora africana]
MRLSRSRPAAGVGLLGTVLAVVVAGSPSVATADPRPAAAASPASSDESAAQAAAHRSGKPVEVLARRTETSEVYANGDGTFTLRQHLRPVRALVDGVWKPTDATLHRAADGIVAPTATTYGMRFSGGGDGPLVVMDSDGGQVALTWPAPLPAPVLNGSTATYPDVLPGVDLQLIADVDSFSENLVVKNRAAAANPALADLRFGVQPHGLDLVSGTDGALRVVNGAGSTVLSVPTPRQWDASPRGTGVAMTTRVADHTLRITPDRSMLTAPDTTYPVVIDPSFPSGYKNHWAVAYKSSTCSSCAGTAYYDAKNKIGSESPPEARVGHESDTGGTARAYFEMNIDGLQGSHIISTTFNVVNAYSYSCTKEPVELGWTGKISSSTTWNSQPTWQTVQTKSFAHGYSSSCPAAGEDYTSATLTSLVQGAADASATSVTLGLRTTDETNTYTWKRFTVNSTNPVLEVTYNHAPTVTASTAYRGHWTNTAADQPLACATDPAAGPVVGLAGTTLTAKVSDADNQSLTTTFTVSEYGGATVATRTATTASGGTASTTMTVGTAAGQLLDGHSYVWTAKTSDGTDASATTGSCGFTVDGIAPTTPAVTATDGHALDVAEVPARQPRTIRFSASDAHLSGFCYTLNQTLSVGGAVCAGGTFVAAGTDGTATVTVVPPRWPDNQLVVVAYDTATNSSANDGSGTVSVLTTPAVFVGEGGQPASGDRRGDFTGDGQVDLISNSSGGGLAVYPGTGTGALSNGQVIASSGFTGALVAHGGDFIGPATGLGPDGYEDVVARLSDGSLTIYPGDGLGHLLTGAGRQYPHPGGTTWSAVTQIATPGNIDGFLGADLLTVEGDSLTLYRGSAQGGLATDASGAVSPGLVLATGWSGWDLVVPGDVTGDGIVDVLGRKHTDTTTDAAYGKLYLFAGQRAGDGSYQLAAPVVYAASGWAPAAAPLLGGSGNAQGTVVTNTDGSKQFQPTAGAGTPDFWNTAPGGTAGTGQLFFDPGTPSAPGTAVKIGDGNWTTIITRIA